MKNKFFDYLTKLKIKKLRTGKKVLDELMLRIIEAYYRMQSENITHKFAIESIISEYFDDDKEAAKCRKFVFKIKTRTDRNFQDKYGEKGVYLAQLHKLIEKIYRENFSNNKSENELQDLNEIADKMDKSFNKITLYMFQKYPL